MAGLSFVDEKEAKQFKKKMDDREKIASKATKATPFQGSESQQAGGGLTNGKSHHRFGIGNLLHSQRSSSAPHTPPPPPQPQPQSIIPPRQVSELASTSPKRDRASSLDTVDPSWRGILGELLDMGITEDQIEQNSDFIKDYIEQRKASGDPIGGTADSAANGSSDNRRVKAPPPPPPGVPPGRQESISPQHTGNTVSSRRGPAPAPPQPRRSRQETPSIASQRKSPSPPRSPERTPSPPRQAYQFRVPPPIADAGKLANAPAPAFQNGQERLQILQILVHLHPLGLQRRRWRRKRTSPSLAFHLPIKETGDLLEHLHHRPAVLLSNRRGRRSLAKDMRYHQPLSHRLHCLQRPQTHQLQPLVRLRRPYLLNVILPLPHLHLRSQIYQNPHPVGLLRLDLLRLHYHPLLERLNHRHFLHLAAHLHHHPCHQAVDLLLHLYRLDVILRLFRRYRSLLEGKKICLLLYEAVGALVAVD